MVAKWLGADGRKASDAANWKAHAFSSTKRDAAKQDAVAEEDALGSSHKRQKA